MFTVEVRDLICVVVLGAALTVHGPARLLHHHLPPAVIKRYNDLAAEFAALNQRIRGEIVTEESPVQVRIWFCFFLGDTRALACDGDPDLVCVVWPQSWFSEGDSLVSSLYQMETSLSIAHLGQFVPPKVNATPLLVSEFLSCGKWKGLECGRRQWKHA